MKHKADDTQADRVGQVRIAFTDKTLTAWGGACSVLAKFLERISFREWVDMGHRLQATAYGKALSAHLATQPYCMGSLLWQWNEPWPGASWSVIDHAGRKKPAYDVIQSILTARARQNPPQD